MRRIEATGNSALPLEAKMALRLLSATDVAIAVAIKSGSLRVTGHNGRFGSYWAIEDDFGLIEVALTAEAAAERITNIEAAL
jgi:hypothetical protein